MKRVDQREQKRKDDGKGERVCRHLKREDGRGSDERGGERECVVI